MQQLSNISYPGVPDSNHELPEGFKAMLDTLNINEQGWNIVPTGVSLVCAAADASQFDPLKNHNWYQAMHPAKGLKINQPEWTWIWRDQQHIMAQTLAERHDHISRLYKHFRCPETNSTLRKIVRQDYIASAQELFGKDFFLFGFCAFLDASALEEQLPQQTLPISSRTIAAAVKELNYKRHFFQAGDTEPERFALQFPAEASADSFYIRCVKEVPVIASRGGLIEQKWKTFDPETESHQLVFDSRLQAVKKELHDQKENRIIALEVTHDYPPRHSLLALFNFVFESALELDRLVVNTPETFREIALRANAEGLFQKMVSGSQLELLFPLLAQLPYDSTMSLVHFLDCLVFFGTYFNLKEVWKLKLVQMGLYLPNRTGRHLHAYALRTLLYNFNLSTKFATIKSVVLPLEQKDILSYSIAPDDSLSKVIPYFDLVDKADD